MKCALVIIALSTVHCNWTATSEQHKNQTPHAATIAATLRIASTTKVSSLDDGEKKRKSSLETITSGIVFYDKELYAILSDQLHTHLTTVPTALIKIIIDYAEKIPTNPNLGNTIELEHEVFDIAWSLCGKHIAIGHDSGYEIRDTEHNNMRVRSITTHSKINSVSWSPCGKRVALGYSDGIRLFGMETGPVGGARNHHGATYSVDWSPHSNRIVSGLSNGNINVRDAEQLAFISSYRDNSVQKILSAAWSPCNKLIAAGGNNGVIILWSHGLEGHSWKGHVGPIRSVTWSRCGNWIVSGGDDTTIRLWCPEKFRCMRIFRGHTDKVCSVRCSPNKQWIASGSNDRTVRIWNILTGTCVSILKGHTSFVTTVAWSPTGEWIASGSEDKTVRIWPTITYDVTQVTH